jgi:hypothetical protein
MQRFYLIIMAMMFFWAVSSYSLTSVLFLFLVTFYLSSFNNVQKYWSIMVIS